MERYRHFLNVGVCYRFHMEVGTVKERDNENVNLIPNKEVVETSQRENYYLLKYNELIKKTNGI